MSKGLEVLEKIKKLNILYDIEMCSNGEEYMKDNNIDLSAIEKELKVLDIIKRHPFILERLFDEADMHDDYNHDYWWGVVTDKEVEMVKEWLNNDK